MAQSPLDDLPGWAQTATEIGVGASILAIRRVNIWRRDLDGPLASAVDVAIDSLDSLVGPASAELGEALDRLAAVSPAPLDQMVKTSRSLAEMAPTLLKMSGLTAPR